MTNPEKKSEKHRVNTWKKRGSQMRTIVGVGTFAIGTIFMTGCDNDYESKHTKASEKHDIDVENVETKKNEMKELRTQDSIIHVNIIEKQKEINAATIKEQTSREELKKTAIESKKNVENEED